jgi:hypothetical protein
MTGDARVVPAVRESRDVLRWSIFVGAVVASFASVIAFAPQLANTARVAWFGRQILATHAVSLRLGTETFTAPGGALYQGWLGAVLVAAAGAVPGGIAILGTLAFFGALGIAVLRTRERGGDAVSLVAVAALATLAGLGACTSPAVTLDWLLLSAIILLIERGGVRGAYVSAALTVVWCNISAQGILVPGLLLAAAGATRLADGGDSPRLRALIRAAALGIVAMLITPALLGLPLRGATYLRIDPSLGNLHAWEPSQLPAHAYIITVVGLCVLAALFGVWRRDRALDTLLVVGGAAFAFANVQYVPEFVLIAAPIIVPAALAALRVSAPGLERHAYALAFCSAGAVALGTATFAPVSAGALATARGPVALVAALHADGRTHRVYCASVDACDAFVAAADPQLRVFMDGRVEGYPKRVIDDQTAIAKVKPQWSARLDHWKVSDVVAGSTSQLAAVLALKPAVWQLHARDGATVLYERSGG